MATIESLVAWIVMILIIFLIVYTIFYWILSKISPPDFDEESTPNPNSKSLHRNIFLVIVLVLGFLSATGGIASMMTES